MNHKYVVISPIRNEAHHLPATYESMAAQIHRPAEWILVDDGSSDDTGRIIDEYAARNPWIRAVHRSDRGFRKPGWGIMQAFYDGFQTLTTTDWDFIVKLDGDVTFDPFYFQNCLQKFSEDPTVGIGGGARYHSVRGKLVRESAPRFHVNGSTKIYRRACWADLGGLRVTTGWDTADEVAANQMGWKTTTFTDLRIVHHRYTGAADGAWKTGVKYGRIGYLCGYHPCFMLARILYRSLDWPWGARGLAMAWGYGRACLTRPPRPIDSTQVRYVHTQQWRRLTGRSSIWQ